MKTVEASAVMKLHYKVLLDMLHPDEAITYFAMSCTQFGVVSELTRNRIC